MSVSSSLSLIIVVLYAWAAAAGPSPIVPEEKLKQVSRGLIIGGRDAELGEFPSFVRIDIRSGSTQAMCGGVIIARNLVLTAGHCNVGENTSYTVSTSQSNQPGDEPNQEIAASRFCLAPNYTFLKSNYTLNDYAILVLEKPFTFNGYVRPASLPEQPISEDELLTAVGIGISNTRLQKIKVQQHYCPSRGEHVNSCFKLFGPEDATIEAGRYPLTVVTLNPNLRVRVH